MDSSMTILERKDKIAILTLNRPEALNTLDLAMIESLDGRLRELATDPDLAALILTGAGDKAFVAGADIAQLRERGAMDAFARINQGLFRSLEEFPAPTIASIHGFALGGGLELAMACDLRVASECSKLGQPEVGLGIIPGAGATHRLQRLVGVGKARELIFTGSIIGAQEALGLGLLNQVVADDEIDEASLALANRIAKNSVGAVRLAKIAINAGPDLSDRGRDMMEVISQAICFESQDKHDRMTRFLERKKK